jgi:hypothetical protein
MAEEQEVTMSTRIESMEGVGPAALEVFNTAGFTTIGQLREFNGDDEKLHKAIHEIRSTMGRVHVNSYWRRLFTRCINIIYRARSAEAADYVPHEFMCPLSLDWYCDPMVAPSGHSFSRQWIEEHLKTSSRNPIDIDQKLSSGELYVNRALADAVAVHQRFRILS